MTQTQDAPRSSRRKLEPQPILIDTADAAATLGIGLTLFNEIDATGELGPSNHRVGRRVLWNHAELQAWVNAGRPRRDKWRKMWITTV